MSLPSRECGLKYVQRVIDIAVVCVTPFAGVWIEIVVSWDKVPIFSSLPSRECGLKYGEMSVHL